MSSTLTTCSFCRLRFANRPLLELHVREDHPQHASPAQPGNGGPADAPVSAPQPRSPASEPPERAAESAAMAGTPETALHPPRALWVKTSLRRVTGAFRRANAEIQLASELMLRPGGVPRPRQPADPRAGQDAGQAAASGRTDRAA